jgi:hypothetical protein
MVKKNSQKYWMLANAVGLVAYLYYASYIWAPRGHEGEFGGPGDPFIWALRAGPIAALALVANLIWLVRVILHIHRTHNWKPLVLWLSVILLWSIAWTYDGTRQYTGADMNYPDSPSAADSKIPARMWTKNRPQR